MQIEQPNSNKHGKSEMTASKRFQIFRRNRLVVIMLTIIDDYRRCSGKNNDDNKTVPNNLPDCHNNRKIQLIWTKIPIIPHYCNPMQKGVTHPDRCPSSLGVRAVSRKKEPANERERSLQKIKAFLKHPFDIAPEDETVSCHRV